MSRASHSKLTHRRILGEVSVVDQRTWGQWLPGLTPAMLWGTGKRRCLFLVGRSEGHVLTVEAADKGSMAIFHCSSDCKVPVTFTVQADTNL